MPCWLRHIMPVALRHMYKCIISKVYPNHGANNNGAYNNGAYNNGAYNNGAYNNGACMTSIVGVGSC